MPRTLLILILILISTFISSCTNQGVGKLFSERTPYQKYTDKLEKADLHKTALGRDWILAGEKALKDSISVDIPFREVGFFPEKQIKALSYAFSARRGEVISVKGTWESREEGDLFIDFFERNSEKPKLLASADSTLTFSLEIEDDAQYVLRIQPELLRSGRYTLEVTGHPSLAYPIPKRDSRTVGSFFGVDREGGKRKHEGVDIFVPKRTPVVAVSEGRITRVNENRLGGKVVFLNDFDKRVTYYYAHLDSQMVVAGEKVKVGDTLGLVGNTGNAKYTPSHLHFSIYSWSGGAIDPLPFLGLSREKFDEVKGSEDLLSTTVAVKGKKVPLYHAISMKPGPASQLKDNSVVELIAANGKYYRVQLPDGEQGYIKTNQIKKLTTIKSSQKIALAMLEIPESDAPVLDTIPEKDRFNILGEHDDYLFVNYNEKQGWVLKDLLN